MTTKAAYSINLSGFPRNIVQEQSITPYFSYPHHLFKPIIYLAKSSKSQGDKSRQF
jgi:hypothetical protein